MTRDSLDDLFIAYQILVQYIDFLDNRLEKQMEKIQNIYANIPLELLSSESKVYVQTDKKKRIKDIENFRKSLSRIRVQTIELYQKYPLKISKISRKQYENNLDEHQKKIISLFQELTKYW